MADRLPIIKSFCLGQWQTNCFVVHIDGPSCWLVDAGFSPEPMIAYVQENNLKPNAVLLTHAHVDHIAGLNDVRTVWPELPILIHQAETEFLTDPAQNLSLVLDNPILAPPATNTLTHGQIIVLDGCDFVLRHTPGHSPGGITLYQPDGSIAIVGDTLFAGSIGRSDFPHSNHAQLLTSIHSELLTLSDETRILPGHGPETTVGHERSHNPFLT